MFLSTLILSLFAFKRAQETILSNCDANDEFEFIFLKDSLDFSDASQSCSELLPPAQLASIPDAVTQTFVESFLFSLQGNITEPFVWIGLFSEELISTDPSDFFFIDGTDFVDDFAQVGGEPPWQEGRPNFGFQDCVGLDEVIFEWDDLDCNLDNRNALCKRPCTQIVDIDNPNDDDDVDDENQNLDEDEENDNFLLFIGAGGGVGVCCLVGALAVFFTVSRRRKNKRKSRDIFKSSIETKKPKIEMDGIKMESNPVASPSKIQQNLKKEDAILSDKKLGSGEQGPNQDYLKATKMKPIDYRSIFAPSPKYIDDNVKNEEETSKNIDNLDI